MLSSILDKLTKARVAGLALVCAAGLGLAACGGSDSTTTVTGSSSTSSTTATDTSTGSTTTGGGSTTSSSDLRQQFDDLLRQNLTEQQGLDPKVADCVITKLQASVSDQQIEDVITSGQLSPAVTKAAANAGATCALQAGG